MKSTLLLPALCKTFEGYLSGSGERLSTNGIAPIAQAGIKSRLISVIYVTGASYYKVSNMGVAKARRDSTYIVYNRAFLRATGCATDRQRLAFPVDVMGIEGPEPTVPSRHLAAHTRFDGQPLTGSTVATPAL